MVRRFTLVVALLGGCDRVFELQTVDPIEPVADCRDPAQLDHDEDDDGHVDGCDNCPGDSNPGQEDMDADGVGNACDPHVAEPIDTLAAFDPFIASPVDARWTMVLGSWTFDGEAAVATSSPAVLSFAAPYDQATAIVYFDGRTDSTGSVGVAAPLLQVRNQAPEGVVCGIVRAAAVTSRLRVSEPPNTANSDSVPLDDNGVVRVQVSATGECLGRVGIGANVMVALDGAPLPPESGQVALFALGAGARFHSITTVTSR